MRPRPAASLRLTRAIGSFATGTSAPATATAALSRSAELKRWPLTFTRWPLAISATLGVRSSSFRSLAVELTLGPSSALRTLAPSTTHVERRTTAAVDSLTLSSRPPSDSLEPDYDGR